jgi:hypothetical protein
MEDILLKWRTYHIDRNINKGGNKNEKIGGKYL